MNNGQKARGKVRSIALIGSGAYSLSNFRGPLIQDLVSKGVKVFALAPDFDEFTEQAVESLGATPVKFALDRAGKNPLSDFRTFFDLRKILSALRPDATFCYFIKPVIYGSLAAWSVGTANRFSLIAGLGSSINPDDESLTFKQRAVQFMILRLYKKALDKCDRVFFQNNEDLNFFIGSNLVDPSKTLRVNGTGVDLRKLPVLPIPRQPLRFILAARLLREKGITDFVDAARLVKKDFPDVQFCLLGGLDSNPTALACQDVQAWVDEGLIEWPGHVNDIVPWMAQASVFVLPSYYREGIPRSIQEAMAMGRAIITTDNVGCRETVEDGVNGFLVPKKSPEVLSHAMLKFCKNPALIEEMGKNSRQMAEQIFDVRKINKQIISIIFQ